MMKKILVINTVEFNISGISVVIMNYFENFDRNKFHMDFVVNNYIAPQYKQELIEKGSKIYVLNRNGKPLKYFFDLMKIIKQGKYDIVHVHGNSCTMAVELLSAKIGRCKKRIAHSHSSTCSHYRVHKLMRPIFEICCTDRLACSNAAGNWLFHNKKYRVIENAIDLQKYHFNPEKRRVIRQRIGLKETEIFIGHVGRFDEQKNQKFAVDILKNLIKRDTKYRMVFVGDGDLKQEIEDYVRKNHLEEYIVFYGVTDDVDGIMSAMDIFLFPSKSEGLGIVMIEAQLVSLPCIASNCVPVDTKMSEYCEYLELSQSIEDWCDVMEHFSEIKISRQERKVDEEKRKSFDITVQAKVLESIYVQ